MATITRYKNGKVVSTSTTDTAPKATATTYTTPTGTKQTGYIINGKTYTDPAGTTSVPYGSIVNTAGGQYVKGLGDTSYTLSDWNTIHDTSGWGNLDASVYGGTPTAKNDSIKYVDSSGNTTLIPRSQLTRAALNPSTASAELKRLAAAYGTAPGSSGSSALSGSSLRGSNLSGYGGSYAVPAYSDRYGAQIDAALQGLLNTQPFQYGENAPEFANRYADRIDAALDAILNRDAFDYDVETDPLYAQYRDQYTREGQRAMQNTYGQAAARTGGLGSSWANSAAQQSNNYYMSQLADKVPQLYQMAYDMYADELNRDVNDLNQLRNAQADEYNQYLNALGQYNTNRNFAYSQYLNGLDQQMNNINALRNAQSDEYNRYLNALNQANLDRNFALNLDNTAYSRSMDAYNAQRQSALDAWNQGMDAYNIQRQSALDAYNRGQDVSAQANELALALLKQGDSRLAYQLAGLEPPAASQPVYYYGGTTSSGSSAANNATDSLRNTQYNGIVSGNNTAGRTSFDYNQDEGIFSWNGKSYSSAAALANAIDAASLTKSEKEEISRKAARFGIQFDFS